jgi:hypothetical protein
MKEKEYIYWKIIPPRFFNKLEKSHLNIYGWTRSNLNGEFFLRGSLTEEQHSGIWINEIVDDYWMIIDCMNKKDTEIIHEGRLNVLELIKITTKLIEKYEFK